MIMSYDWKLQNRKKNSKKDYSGIHRNIDFVSLTHSPIKTT